MYSDGENNQYKSTAADPKVDSVNSDMWVGTDDVITIFRSIGISVTSASVVQSVRALQHFLPGISEGKLCFQVRQAVDKSF